MLQNKSESALSNRSKKVRLAYGTVQLNLKQAWTSAFRHRRHLTVKPWGVESESSFWGRFSLWICWIRRRPYRPFHLDKNNLCCSLFAFCSTTKILLVPYCFYVYYAHYCAPFIRRMYRYSLKTQVILKYTISISHITFWSRSRVRSPKFSNLGDRVGFPQKRSPHP